MKTTMRIMRPVVRDVLRNRRILAYFLFFVGATDALVSLLNLVLLLIPLVTIVFGTIYWHGAREFNELLLTQPVARHRLFHGLFAGLVVPLSAAFVLGVSIPLLLHRAVGVDHVSVLVVDDHPDARELLERVLIECGAVVHMAGTAQEAD